MTDNSALIRLGEALYGPQWQAPLARALGVNKDTVQDWRQGRFKPRQGVYDALVALATVRGEELDRALAELILSQPS